MIIETVQDLIDELKRQDPKARVGVTMYAKSYGEKRAFRTDSLRVEPDHSGSRVEVEIVGEQ